MNIFKGNSPQKALNVMLDSHLQFNSDLISLIKGKITYAEFEKKMGDRKSFFYKKLADVVEKLQNRAEDKRIRDIQSAQKSQEIELKRRQQANQQLQQSLKVLQKTFETPQQQRYNSTPVPQYKPLEIKPMKQLKQIDGGCMSQCANSGYSYGLCESKCSY